MKGIRRFHEKEQVCRWLEEEQRGIIDFMRRNRCVGDWKRNRGE